jgi:predicted Zn-dependent protease
MSSRFVPAILAGALLLGLGGCAATKSQSGRQQVVVPTPVSEVYSEVDLQMKLATASPPTEEQSDDQCLQLEYQRQIRKLIERTVAVAMRLYPDLAERDIKFRFEVAPSAESGVLSNAGGTVIVLQGTQNLRLPESVLTFIVAREMGHVIARHHDENSAATVMFSVLTQVLFPAAALVKGLSVVLPSTAMGTAATASALSYLGATALKTTYRSDHLREAEEIALTLLVESGWDIFDVAGEATAVVIKEGESAWLDELRQSLSRLDLAAYGPRRYPFHVQPAPAG